MSRIKKVEAWKTADGTLCESAADAFYEQGLAVYQERIRKWVNLWYSEWKETDRAPSEGWITDQIFRFAPDFPGIKPVQLHKCKGCGKTWSEHVCPYCKTIVPTSRKTTWG